MTFLRFVSYYRLHKWDAHYSMRVSTKRPLLNLCERCLNGPLRLPAGRVRATIGLHVLAVIRVSLRYGRHDCACVWLRGRCRRRVVLGRSGLHSTVHVHRGTLAVCTRHINKQHKYIYAH